MNQRKSPKLFLAAVLCGLLAQPFNMALAQQIPTTAEIINSLKPKAPPPPPPPEHSSTRALTIAPQQPPATSSAQDKTFIDSLRGRETRKITIEEKQTFTKIASEKPSIDLEITFDYNSDVIGPKAIPVLANLGAALRSGELKDTVFVLAGHTDAAGEDGYNQILSERRADAVKRFLVEKFSLAPKDLIPIGYGKTQPKNQADPFAGENRRVQIVNTEVK